MQVVISQGMDSIAQGQYVEEEQEAREDPGRGASERKGSGGLPEVRIGNTSPASCPHILSLAANSSLDWKGL